MSKIITNYEYPSIWTATRDGWEPGCLIGYGETEQEAIRQLLTNEADDHLPYYKTKKGG